MFLHSIIAYSIGAMDINILLSDSKSLFLSVVLIPHLKWLQAVGCSNRVPKRSHGKLHTAEHKDNIFKDKCK